jgi:hypothetical protein
MVTGHGARNQPGTSPRDSLLAESSRKVGFNFIFATLLHSGNTRSRLRRLVVKDGLMLPDAAA